MDRNDLIAAILASAGGAAFTPVQLQKAAFLITRNLPDAVTEGPAFNFVPYDYGPFDSDVYNQAESLRKKGLAAIYPSQNGRWKIYAATQAGIERGTQVLNSMNTNYQGYIRDVSIWVRSQSFSSLVKSIYDAYPDMRVNSIFTE